MLATRGGTTVVDLHDLNLAAAYCTRIAMLGNGRLMADGSPHEVLRAERVAEVYGVRARADHARPATPAPGTLKLR